MKDVKEIEVKARVSDFNKILNQLQKLGCVYSAPIIQKDTVFLPKGVTFSDITYGTNALRIREEENRNIFTLKQRQEIELSAIEAETEIKDSASMRRIIELLGFYEAVKIKKIRRKTRYKNYEICLDEVENLGNFIEVEVFSSEDGEKIQHELFEFLKSLGIQSSDREKKGYDTLMYQIGNYEKKI